MNNPDPHVSLLPIRTVLKTGRRFQSWNLGNRTSHYRQPLNRPEHGPSLQAKYLEKDTTRSPAFHLFQVQKILPHSLIVTGRT